MCGTADIPQIIPKPIRTYFPFPLHTAFHSGNPRAPVCGSDGMPQYVIISTPIRTYVPFRMYPYVRTLPLCSLPFCSSSRSFRACANTAYVRTYVCTARFLVISAWLRSLLLCSDRTSIVCEIRTYVRIWRGSLSFPHGCVPFRSVPFHSTLFRKRG